MTSGTVVEATVHARVLGLRLITIDARIVLAPAELAPRRVPAPTRGLAEAARFIDEGETALAAARNDGATRW